MLLNIVLGILLTLLSLLICLILLAFRISKISFTEVSSESFVVVIYGFIEVLTEVILLRKRRLILSITSLLVVGISKRIILEVEGLPPSKNSRVSLSSWLILLSFKVE